MAKSKTHLLHCDSHVLVRAVMSQSDFDQINKGLKDAINASLAHCAQGSVATKAHGATTSPTSNTGGKVELVLENGKIKEVLKRKHYQSKTAIIDWVNFTVHESTFELMTNAVSDKEVIFGISVVCESIFGFGITAQRERGANFYKTSYTLGNSFGLVCYGGQRNTVLVMLTGEGCAAARHGWERRLYDFLNFAQNSKITRVDLAHDDYTGDTFTVDKVEAAYDNGLFNTGGRHPDCEMRGNWKNPNGKGRTFTVGSRTNGKFFRGYEKGKQLGDEHSAWFRAEVEFKSVDRIIPFDCLLYPHEYLAAAYPILEGLSIHQERILTTQKTVEISYERTKKWLKHQCGSALNLVHEMDGFDGIKELFRDGKLPKGVDFPSFLNVKDAMHHDSNPHTPIYMASSF